METIDEPTGIQNCKNKFPDFFTDWGKYFSFINKSTISVKARETFGIFYVKAIDYLNPQETTSHATRSNPLNIIIDITFPEKGFNR